MEGLAATVVAVPHFDALVEIVHNPIRNGRGNAINTNKVAKSRGPANLWPLRAVHVKATEDVCGKQQLNCMPTPFIGGYARGKYLYSHGGQISGKPFFLSRLAFRDIPVNQRLTPLIMIPLPDSPANSQPYFTCAI